MTHQRRHTRRMRKTGTTFTAGRYEYNFADRRSDSDVALELKTIGRQMWGSIVDSMTFHVERENKGALAYLKSLAREKRWLIGDTLVRAKREYTLGVNSKFYDLSKEDQRRVLIHEAAHIGCADHDRLFRKKVLEAGGVLAEANLEHDRLYVKAKLKTLPKSAKYAVIGEYSVMDYETALDFAVDYIKKNPQYRVQLSSNP